MRKCVWQLLPDGLKIAGLCAKAYNKLPNEFNYQGNYAEEEEESGYDEFALRHYDPTIGRWLSTDPYDEFASPYVGMGNDPVNNTDPDGGTAIATAAGAWDEMPATTGLHTIGGLGGSATPAVGQFAGTAQGTSLSSSSAGSSGGGSAGGGALNALGNAVAGYLGQKVADKLFPLPKGPDAGQLQQNPAKQSNDNKSQPQNNSNESSGEKINDTKDDNNEFYKFAYFSPNVLSSDCSSFSFVPVGPDKDYQSCGVRSVYFDWFYTAENEKGQTELGWGHYAFNLLYFEFPRKRSWSSKIITPGMAATLVSKAIDIVNESLSSSGLATRYPPTNTGLNENEILNKLRLTLKVLGGRVTKEPMYGNVPITNFSKSMFETVCP